MTCELGCDLLYRGRVEAFACESDLGFARRQVHGRELCRKRVGSVSIRHFARLLNTARANCDNFTPAHSRGCQSRAVLSSEPLTTYTPWLV